MHFHDLDPVVSVRRHGLDVAILSGDGSPAGRRVAERFGIDETVWGGYDKLVALQGARAAADHVLDAAGGRGAVAAAVTLLEHVCQLPRERKPR